MGQGTIKKPTKLSIKLLSIRNQLGFTQGELINALGMESEVSQSQISAFERGTRIPSLLILLKYAKLAQISTDSLLDDEIEL